VTREPNPHVAFGAADALLPRREPARIETRIIFEALLTRFDGLAVDGDPAAMPRVHSNLIDGFAHLPVRWDSSPPGPLDLRMTRRGWLLFAAMSVIWGVPYLLIKVAVEHVEPAVVVFARTAVAAVPLLVVAARTRALRPAVAHWKPVLAFAAIEMAGPWLLLTNAEQRLPSGVTGLIVSCVPIVGAIAAYALGDHTALRPVRVLGHRGRARRVALLVGGDLSGHGGIPWASVIEVLLVCVGYATAPFIVARRLGDVPTLGVVAIALATVAVAVAPLAWFARPDAMPPATALWALLGLAVICTGIAFVLFFALIADIGPARATLITFVNPRSRWSSGRSCSTSASPRRPSAGFVLVLVAASSRHDPRRSRSSPSPRSPRPNFLVGLASSPSPTPQAGPRSRHYASLAR